MKTFSASFAKLRIAAMAALMLAALAKPASGASNSIYPVDPVVTALTRTVVVAISRGGGSFDVPASDGVAAHVTYPPNDACSGAAMRFAGLGPAAVARASVPSVWAKGDPGWKMFYEGIVSIENCANDVRFTGFPTVRFDIPKAAKGTVYYADLAVEAGNDVHIPLGPPSEEDPTRVTFDFSTLPLFMHTSEGGVAFPQGNILRLVVARQ
jgi:hypothetical protein